MNLQSVIDQLPMILVGFSLVLLAASKLVAAIGQRTPGEDAWDKAAPKLDWAARMISQGIDWLCDSGKMKWTGQEKLAELNKRVRDFETMVSAGKYVDAIGFVIGFYRDAKGKMEKAVALSSPFAPSLRQPMSQPIPLAGAATSQDEALANAEAIDESSSGNGVGSR